MRRFEENDEKYKLLKKPTPMRKGYIVVLATVLILVYLMTQRDDDIYFMDPMKDPVTCAFTVIGAIMIIALIASPFIMKRRRYIFSQIEYIESVKDVADHAKTVSEYIENYDEEIRKLNEFVRKHGKYERYLNGLKQNDEERDFQWHLRETIAREASEIITKMKKTFGFSKEHRMKLYYNFTNEIASFKNRLEGDETWELVGRCLKKVYVASGADVPIHYDLLGKHLEQKNERDSGFKSENELITRITIEDVDKIDGHQFEHFCAELLMKNGYTDAQVTRGSGDQGVDVLAKKGGVKYAFQCKNYCSQLGNTPIQEVHAGKVYYNCHVGVVMTNNYFTSGAIALAERTGVLLWDRDVVVDMMKAFDEEDMKELRRRYIGEQPRS